MISTFNTKPVQGLLLIKPLKFGSSNPQSIYCTCYTKDSDGARIHVTTMLIRQDKEEQ